MGTRKKSVERLRNLQEDTQRNPEGGLPPLFVPPPGEGIRKPLPSVRAKLKGAMPKAMPRKKRNKV